MQSSWKLAQYRRWEGSNYSWEILSWVANKDRHQSWVRKCIGNLNRDELWYIRNYNPRQNRSTDFKLNHYTPLTKRDFFPKFSLHFIYYIITIYFLITDDRTNQIHHMTIQKGSEEQARPGHHLEEKPAQV